MNKIIARSTIAVCLLLSFAACVEARTRAADKLVKMGEKAESQKQYDKAVTYYDQAVTLDPNEPAYLIADQRAHTKAGEWHIEQGKYMLSGQRLQDAAVEFQRALLADPSSQIAIQEIRTTNQMIAEAKRTNKPVLTPAERARQEVENRLNSLQGPPQLKPITDLIRSLKMNNQTARVLYESVGKLAGVNVLLDPIGIESTPGKTFNLDLNNVTLEEALDYIALETHTFWKPISRNAIFVTQENEPKRQEYQDELIKVFYIQNATNTQEFTEIFNAVRTSAKLSNTIYQVASQNAIVVRGSEDAIAIVEKLIHDLDKPKSEVVVDVVVMEVNKTRTTTLGASLLGQGGLSIPLTYTPRRSVTVGTGSSSTTTTNTGTGGTSTSSGTGGTSTSTNTGTTSAGTSSGSTGFVTLAQLGHFSSADYATTLPSALLEALMTDSASRILQRPQLRCTDGGKSSLKIGERIPYVSGSINTAVASSTSGLYSTTQFNQIDVGVNIDIEPHVNGPEDVSLKIKVEISNENGSVNIGGISEPIITQRVNEAQIRMKDGEVGLLGGLSDKEQSNALSGFPGLTNIPILGYLFGSKTKTKADDEILVALIPHIVRSPDLSHASDPGVYAGSEHALKVHRKTVITGDDGYPEGKPDGTGQQNVPIVPPTAPGPPYTTTPPPGGASGSAATPAAPQQTQPAPQDSPQDESQEQPPQEQPQDQPVQQPPPQ